MMRPDEPASVSPRFYLRNLLVMFVGAVPITAVLTGIFSGVLPGDSGIAADGIATAVADNLRVLYFWAWPAVGLLSLLHTLALHVMPFSWGLRHRWPRILLGVGGGLVFGIIISIANDFAVRALVRTTVDYMLLGGVYGVLTVMLVPTPRTRGATSRGNTS